MGVARRSLLVALLALGLLPASASAATKIVGGSDANTGQFPYQVSVDTPVGGCGGSILDARHIVTAAHCVEDDSGFYPRVVTPSEGFVIRYGGVDIGSGGDTTTFGGEVTRVSVDPRRQRRLFGDEYDSAILTLDSDLPINTADVDDIALASASDLTSSTFGFGAMPNNTPFISGWGDVAEGGPSSDTLKYAQVPLVPDSGAGFSCDDAYGPDELVKPVMLCAGEQAGGTDTCQGDSGGPLALDSVDGDNGSGNGPGSGTKLAGITSFGNGCAEPGVPGVYTEVPESGTHSFLLSAPPSAPNLLGDASITGTPQVGKTVTCHTPPLPAGVHAQRYFWSTVDSEANVTEFTEGPSASLVLPAATQGRQVACDARIENAGGYQYLEGTLEGALGPVTAAAAKPPPPPPPKDTTKPRTRVRKVRCKRRRCTITIKATDTGGLVTKVSARVRGRYKKCRRVAGKRRCKTRKLSKRLRLKKKSGGNFVGKIKLKRGRYAVTAQATDTAGNKSKKAKKKFRVR